MCGRQCAVCSVQCAVCSVQCAVCQLPTADCRLLPATCYLPTVDCPLPSRAPAHGIIPARRRLCDDPTLARLQLLPAWLRDCAHRLQSCHGLQRHAQSPRYPGLFFAPPGQPDHRQRCHAAADRVGLPRAASVGGAALSGHIGAAGDRAGGRAFHIGRAELAKPGPAYVPALRAGQAADHCGAGRLLGALRAARRRIQGAARRAAAGEHPHGAGVHSARLRHCHGLRDSLAYDGLDGRAALVAVAAADDRCCSGRDLWLAARACAISESSPAGVHRPGEIRPAARKRRLADHAIADRDRVGWADRPGMDPWGAQPGRLSSGSVHRFHLRNHRRRARLLRRGSAVVVRNAADLAGAGDRRRCP